MELRVHVYFQICVFVFFRKIPRSRIAGSYGNSIFSFLKEALCCFHSGASIYIPTNSVRGFPFSTSFPIRVIVFSMLPLWRVWSDTALWFRFAVPWWLMILITFPGTYWPSVCLSGKMSIWILCSFFNWIIFLYWVVWVLCVFWILTSYQISCLEISSPIQ